MLSTAADTQKPTTLSSTMLLYPSKSSSLLSTNNRTGKMMMTKCHRPQRCQIQYHNGKSTLSSSSSSLTTSSFYGLNKWLWTAVLFGLLIVTASAIDEVSFFSKLKKKYSSNFITF